MALDSSQSSHTAAITSELLGPVAPTSLPQVRAIAISSLNGSLSLDGVSGGLGNELDQALLTELRHWSDAILVTAHTAKIEQYGPAECPQAIAELRKQRGQAAHPQLVLLTRSIEKYLSLPLTTEQFANVVFLTPSNAELIPSEEVLRGYGARALLYDANRPASLIEALHSAGYNRISCEGGPSLYEFLLTHSLLDVLHLTIAPIISTPVSHSLARGDSDWQQKLTLEHTYSDAEGLLFTRYRVS